MKNYLPIQMNWFKPGDRIYDTVYNKIGVVFAVDELAIQVAFTENISRHPGALKFQRCYEAKFFVENSRLQIVNEFGDIKNLETHFEL